MGRTCQTDPTAPDSRAQVRKCTALCRDCGLYVRKKVVEVVTSCNCRSVILGSPCRSITNRFLFSGLSGAAKSPVRLAVRSK